MLQTRNGKRTTRAALKVAVVMTVDGVITRAEAILRVDAAELDQLLHPTIDPSAERDVVTRGLPASPGAATGRVVFSSEEAERIKLLSQENAQLRAERLDDRADEQRAEEALRHCSERIDAVALGRNFNVFAFAERFEFFHDILTA